MREAMHKWDANAMQWHGGPWTELARIRKFVGPDSREVCVGDSVVRLGLGGWAWMGESRWLCVTPCVKEMR